MAETISSFWGPVTSTKECCEENYTAIREKVQYPSSIKHDTCHWEYVVPRHTATSAASPCTCKRLIQRLNSGTSELVAIAE
ncbi:hypothetical protein L195_g036903, partial [Trifolium pratense]